MLGIGPIASQSGKGQKLSDKVRNREHTENLDQESDPKQTNNSAIKESNDEKQRIERSERWPLYTGEEEKKPRNQMMEHPPYSKKERKNKNPTKRGSVASEQTKQGRKDKAAYQKDSMPDQQELGESSSNDTGDKEMKERKKYSKMRNYKGNPTGQMYDTCAPSSKATAFRGTISGNDLEEDWIKLANRYGRKLEKKLKNNNAICTLQEESEDIDDTLYDIEDRMNILDSAAISKCQLQQVIEKYIDEFKRECEKLKKENVDLRRGRDNREIVEDEE